MNATQTSNRIKHDVAEVERTLRLLFKPGQIFEIRAIGATRTGDWQRPGTYSGYFDYDQIPLAARILSVADTLDAMTSDRSYRAALPLATAVKEIHNNAGVQFCPRVVDAFLRCFQRDPTLEGKFTLEGRDGSSVAPLPSPASQSAVA